MITHRNIVSDASGFVKVTEVNFWDVAISLHVHWLTLGLENESGKGRGEMTLLCFYLLSQWGKVTSLSWQ